MDAPGNMTGYQLCGVDGDAVDPVDRVFDAHLVQELWHDLPDTNGDHSFGGRQVYIFPHTNTQGRKDTRDQVGGGFSLDPKI